MKIYLNGTLKSYEQYRDRALFVSKCGDTINVLYCEKKPVNDDVYVVDEKTQEKFVEYATGLKAFGSGENPSGLYGVVNLKSFFQTEEDVFFDVFSTSYLCLNSVTGTGERCAQTLWTINPADSLGFFPYKCTLPFKNQFAETYVSKHSCFKKSHLRDKVVVGFGTPLKESSLDSEESFLFFARRDRNWRIFLYGLDDCPIVELEDYDAVCELIQDSFPTIEITSPTTCTSEGCELHVATMMGEEEVVQDMYLSTSAGYLSKTHVTSSTDTIKFIPLGLQSGDVAEIKVGFKTYTNKSNVLITVE